MASSNLQPEVCRLLFEAVEEKSSDKFTLAKSTCNPALLLTCLHHCNEHDETPLTMAYRVDNQIFISDVMSFLEEHGSFLYKVLPKLFEFAFQNVSASFPAAVFVDTFVDCSEDFDWLQTVVSLIYKSTSFDRKSMIEALEFAGATVIIQSFGFKEYYEHHIQLSTLGLQCWKQAMDLRFSGEPLLPKTPHVFLPSSASSKVFGSTQELASGAELTNFIEEYQMICVDGAANHRTCEFEKTLKIQALLVTRRICSAPNIFDRILYRERLIQVAMDSKKGAISQGHYDLFVNGCLMYLEEVLSYQETIPDEELIEQYTATLANMTIFFVKVGYLEWDNFIGGKHLSYVNLLDTVNSIVKFANLFAKPTMLSTIPFGKFDRQMIEIEHLGDLLYHLFVVLFHSNKEFTDLEWQHLTKYFSYFNSSLFAERSDTVLHVAVRQKNVCHATVRVILKLGADPNAKDHNGRTPLHLLAARIGETQEYFGNLMRHIVNAGAHLDLAADDGKTVESILGEIVKEWKDAGMIIDPYYESLSKTVSPLTCLCARVIGLNQIPYGEDRLPNHLQELVSLHSSAQDAMDLS